ncbi:rhotekin-like [Diadema antillarum]|uniref:rhotekin-like n=1 Tax=Diadema antillarum TaxID=105358 RepID=UPI003A86154F
MATFQRQFQAVRRSLRRKRNYDIVFEHTPVTKRKKVGEYRPDLTNELASMDIRASIAQDGSRWDIIEDLDLFYFRQLAVSLQDYDMQQKIDLEIKMREGTRKLLAACKRENQSLEAAKNLLTSNVRVLSYVAELQRRKAAQFADRAASRKVKSAGGSDSGVEAESGSDLLEPCRSKVCISDLQIPLMWRDVDHIKNRGDHHRYAVFCLLKIDTQIYATQLVHNIDRKATDVTFSDVIIFDNVRPDFTCTLEVYSYNLHNDMTIASTPQKIRRKLNSLSSVGRRSSLGHKQQLTSSLSLSTEEEAVEGPKYCLVARARLQLQDVSDHVQTFDLCPQTDGRTHHQLPLFGNICCRMASQPSCVVQEIHSGYVTCEEEFHGEPVSSRVWCTLRGCRLECWEDPTDSSLGVPIKCVELRKNSSAVRSSESSTCSEPFSFVVTGCHGDPDALHLFQADTEEELESWLKAVEQQLVNIDAWSESCYETMKIYSPYPRRSDLVLAQRKGSLYDELSIVSPDREEFNDENVFQGSPADNLRSRHKLRAQSISSVATSSTTSSSSSSSTSSSPPPLFPSQKASGPKETSV